MRSCSGNGCRPGSSAGLHSLASLEALCDAYQREVVGLAYQLVGDLRLAEEVAEAIFLTAWREGVADDLSGGSARKWLLSRVRIHSTELLRGQPSQPSQRLDGRSDGAGQADGHAQDADGVGRALAMRRLDALPPEQRQVVELAYYGGLGLEQIAERTGIQVSTIRALLRQALDGLRLVRAG